jgi:GNAT superfamily N-acetyltransferase
MFDKASDTSAVAPARSADMFSSPKFRAVTLSEANAPRLQEFFERNPEYSLLVDGEPPGPGRALENIRATLPDGYAYTEVITLGWENSAGQMVAMANCVFDLLATGVFHIGLFMVDTRHWGSGSGRGCCAALENGARKTGMRWLRLGVVIGNTRAEEFWSDCGFVEVRRREGVEMGRKIQNLRVMVKPLCGEPIADYLERVARDNPGAP